MRRLFLLAIGTLVLAPIEVILTVTAAVDLARRPADRIRDRLTVSRQREPLPALELPHGPQGVVDAGDRCPTDPKFAREIPLGGKPGSERKAAVSNQERHTVFQRGRDALPVRDPAGSDPDDRALEPSRRTSPSEGGLIRRPGQPPAILSA